MTTENTDSELKVHALHYANELLVRVRLSFQKLLQNRSTYRNNAKRMFWEKSNDAYGFSPDLGGKNDIVLSMRMQVILDSSFARPGSAPIWGGKKGEFRDWTNVYLIGGSKESSK